MPTPAIPPLYRMVLFGKITGVQEFRNTFYYYSNEAALATQPHRATLNAWLADPLRACVTNNFAFYQMSWEYMDTEGVWQPYVQDTLNYAGSRSTPSCPLTVAAVVIGKTAKRRTFGRKFIGPIAVSDQSAGVPSGSLITNLGVFANHWGNPLGTDGVNYYPGVWSPEFGFTYITGFKLAPLLGTQHNRKIGQGI